MCRKRTAKAKRRKQWRARHYAARRTIRRLSKGGTPAWLAQSLHGEPAAGEGA